MRQHFRAYHPRATFLNGVKEIKFLFRQTTFSIWSKDAHCSKKCHLNSFYAATIAAFCPPPPVPHLCTWTSRLSLCISSAVKCHRGLEAPSLNQGPDTAEPQSPVFLSENPRAAWPSLYKGCQSAGLGNCSQKVNC